jgi:hypothetical protein
MFRCISEKFTAMIGGKQYFYWYTKVGMDEEEFTAAESKLSELLSEYQEHK